MNIALSLGWWIAPAVITVALFTAWRLFGVRMQPNNGGMFPDAAGGMLEAGGYLVMALLAVIVWLIWAVLT
jgi:hypothetical protein